MRGVEKDLCGFLDFEFIVDWGIIDVWVDNIDN